MPVNVMIPIDRIHKQNFWCPNDDSFLRNITSNFENWIAHHGKENGKDEDNGENRENEENEADIYTDIKKGGCDLKTKDQAMGKNEDREDAHSQNEMIKTNDVKGGGCGNIPKIFHFIWLGSELPVVYGEFIDTWKIRHPLWTIKIWGDEDAKAFNMRNHVAYSAATNYGMKSDIFRYEIILKHGGIYVDTDYECVNNIDFLCMQNSFFCGLANATVVEINNGIFGSVPNHIILRNIIDSIYHTFEKQKNDDEKEEKKEKEEKEAKKKKDALSSLAKFDVFMSFLTPDEGVALKKAKEHSFMDTIRLTGPGLMTKILYDHFCVLSGGDGNVDGNDDGNNNDNTNNNDNNDNNDNDDNNDNNDGSKNNNNESTATNSINSNNDEDNTHKDGIRDDNNKGKNYYHASITNSNVMVFPFTVFNPVPNSENTDLTNECEKKNLKEKYILSYKNKKIENENENENESKNENEKGRFFFNQSYAIHWWAKSWIKK